MTWALDGEVAGAGRGRRPPDRPPTQVAAVLRVCNEAGDPGHRGGRPQRRVRRVGAGLRRRGPRPVRPHRASSTSTTTSLTVDVLAGTFGDHFEHELRTDARPHLRPLAAVDDAVDRRRLARLPRRRPALDPLRQDRGHGRRPRRRPRRRHRRSTPAATPARPPAPTSTSSSSAPRARSASSPAPGCGCTRRPSHERRARLRLRRRSPTALDACRRILRRGATPAVLRLYDAVEADRSYQTGDRRTCCSCSTRATRRSSTPRSSVVAEECAGAEHLDRRRSSSTGWSTATTWPRSRRSSAGASSSTRWRSPGRGRSCRPSTTAAVAAIRAVDGTLAASAHQSHAYADGACLYFTFAGKPDPTSKDAYYRAAWDAGTRAVLAAGGALSHHHGVGLNRARFMREALGAGLDVLGRDEGGARPERHPQPGQARPAHPVRRQPASPSADRS